MRKEHRSDLASVVGRIMNEQIDLLRLLPFNSRPSYYTIQSIERYMEDLALISRFFLRI